jgi:glycosyltransferase involved in cell wall biosynthesis
MQFSVVLPVYNRAASIAPAIESVLDQTRPADEVLIIDDGSTDDIESALAPYKDRVRLIRQSNAGVAAARNAAVAAASGEWLAFQDSDDLWLPTHLESAARDIELAGQEVVCHLGNVVYTGEGYAERLFDIKGRTFPAGSAEKVDDPLPLVVSGMTLQGAAIRRDVFNRLGGFDTKMRMLSDTALFCQLALEGPFLVTADLMAEIRRLPGDQDSITSLHRKNALYARQMHVRILDRMLPRPLTKEQKVLVNRLLSGAEFRLAEVVRRSSPSDARKLLWRSAMRHPKPLVGLSKAMIAMILGRAGYRFVLDRHRGLDRS